MTPFQKIALYSLAIAAAVIATQIYRGSTFEVWKLAVIALFVPVCGAMIWLRWDWALKERRKRHAERQREREARSK